MKKFNSFIAVFVFLFCCSLLSSNMMGQNEKMKLANGSLSKEDKTVVDGNTTSLSYQVDKILPSISHTKEALAEMKTLSDLNRFFKPEWIRTYESIAITSIVNGKVETATGTSDMLTQEQKTLIQNTDVGTELRVDVNYYPENTLILNELKTYDFNFYLDPEKDAEFMEGDQKLQEYFKHQAIDLIPDGVFTGYKFASVKFQIDEEGRVTNPHVFFSSEDEEVDKLLLDAVCNMPVWKPAEYSNGTKLKQEFSLSVGNMESCAVNLLNTKRFIEKREAREE